MMNKKNTILIAITAVAFAISGYLVYKSFSGPAEEGDPNLSVPGQAPSVSVNILPLGSKLDLSPVKKINSQFNVYTYPKVSPQSIGVSVSNLIKSSSEASQPGS